VLLNICYAILFNSEFKVKAMHTCGIIEDEHLAQQLLIKYILRYGSIEIKWALETIREAGMTSVDVLFLDLLDTPSNDFKTDERLNKVSEGLHEFIKGFSKIIITTAYPVEYVNSLDVRYDSILVKPYTYSSFVKALEYTLK
jgi:hypothetical protein